MKPIRVAVTALATLALAVALAACGSSSSGSSTTSTTTAAAAKPAHGDQAAGAKSGGGGGKGGGKQTAGAPPAHRSQPEPHFTPRPHHDSGGGASQFEQKGGDNSIQRFGGEAPGSEFAQAATALHNYLDARAAGAWAAACSYMSQGVAKGLSQLAGGKPAPCPELLAALSAGLPPQALKEAAVADVGALRTEGERAFLIFTGAHGVHYFIPMASEGGEWKVAALAPSALG